MSMFPEIMKNLFSKPATRKYPFEKRAAFAQSRGKVVFDQTKCDHCGDCARICPAGAIEVNEKEKKIEYDQFRCIYCWDCAEKCLQNAIKKENEYTAPACQKSKLTFAK